jgi:phospholipid/cholesterol/gamma-HCH transport system substrate-binding protein
MANTTKSNFRLGLFVLVGLGMFLGALYYMGSQRNLFGSQVHVHSLFRDINGLQEGNNVRFSGINVGTVEGISIVSDSIVRVDLVLDEGVRQFIRTDSKVVIGAEGLMGSKVLTISPGSAAKDPITNGDTLQSIPAFSYEQILVSVKTVADNAAVLTGDLAGIFQNMRAGKGTIGKLLYDDALANKLDQALTGTTQNLERSSRKADEVLEATKGSFLLRGYFKRKEKAKRDSVENLKKAAEKDVKKKARLDKRSTRKDKRAARKAKRKGGDEADKPKGEAEAPPADSVK